MQCVSWCIVAGSQGQELRCAGSTCTYGDPELIGSPPAGPDTELMVCSSGRRVGMLNLAV